MAEVVKSKMRDTEDIMYNRKSGDKKGKHNESSNEVDTRKKRQDEDGIKMKGN